MPRTRLDKLVDEFASEMKKRLREKTKDGWTGWDDDRFHEGEINHRIMRQIFVYPERVEKDSNHPTRTIDPVDLANYCAFLNYKRTGGGN